jgi:hypothetical protein
VSVTKEPATNFQDIPLTGYGLDLIEPVNNETMCTPVVVKMHFYLHLVWVFAMQQFQPSSTAGFISTAS